MPLHGIGPRSTRAPIGCINEGSILVNSRVLGRKAGMHSAIHQSLKAGRRALEIQAPAYAHDDSFLYERIEADHQRSRCCS